MEKKNLIIHFRQTEVNIMIHVSIVDELEKCLVYDSTSSKFNP